MHRKQGAEFLPLDTEIERTLRGLRKVKSAEIAEMADDRGSQPGIRSRSTSRARHYRGLLETSYPR